MRLLCCADTHGEVPPALDERGATAWLHAGDVENGPDVDASMRDGDPLLDPLLAPVANWFRTRSLPIFAVRGNHDCIDVYRAFDNGRDVTGRVVALAPGVWLVGLGWHGERHFELPTESNLLPLAAMAEQQLLRPTRSCDAIVVLTHFPPRLDEHRPVEADDSLALRAFIDRLKPVLVVEGHVHRRAGQSLVLKHADGRATTIVNPGPSGCTIDVATRLVTITPSCLPPRPASARP